MVSCSTPTSFAVPAAMASGRSVSRRMTSTGLRAQGLLLQAAGVGQDEEAAGHQVVHLLDVDRIDEVDARMAPRIGNAHSRTTGLRCTG